MNSDLIKMIGNVSQSLIPVQALIAGFGYLVGIIFFYIAIGKLRKIGDSRARGGSHEKMFIPLAYFLGGAALIFLPTTLTVLSNTAFGTDSILAYATYNPYNIYDAMKLVIKTMGLIWFVRGCVLLVHASEPGVQEGPKGLTFLFAGILAMNFEGTISILNYMMDHMMDLGLSAKKTTGG